MPPTFKAIRDTRHSTRNNHIIKAHTLNIVFKSVIKTNTQVLVDLFFKLSKRIVDVCFKILVAVYGLRCKIN